MEKKLLVKYTDVQICREELTILDHVNFELYSGEFVYFIGRVGSGKSSLLKTMYADLPISEGEASVLDFDVRHIRNKEIPLLRRKLGIVFQDFQLLTDRSVYENLAFVLKATGWKDKEEIDTRVAVGRRTAAYRHRTGSVELAQDYPGRRAYRKPRPPDRAADCLAASPHLRNGNGCNHDNAQPESGRGVPRAHLEMRRQESCRSLIWPE